jgi:hypothetical protein
MLPGFCTKLCLTKSTISAKTASTMRLVINDVTDRTTAVLHALPPQNIPGLYNKTLPPLLLLTQKDQRTLIHAVSILHARSIFTRALIIGGENTCQLTKTKALARSLNLNGYVCFDSDPAFLQRQSDLLANTQPWFLALTVSEPMLVELIADGIAPNCAIIGYDGKYSADSLLQSLKNRMTPSLDSQALAQTLEKQLFTAAADTASAAQNSTAEKDFCANWPFALQA